MDFRAKSRGTMKMPSRENFLTFEDSTQRGADFSGRNLLQFGSVGSRFESCHFDEVQIDDAVFAAGTVPSVYVDCSFDRARIRFGAQIDARFVRCSFRDVELADWFCFTTELVDCTFSGRLRKAFFNGTVPEERRAMVGRDQNEFRGNDFSRMDLIDVAFRTGIDLTLQRLPSGPSYLYLASAEEAVHGARAAILSWEDLESRRKAMAEIRALESELEGRQRQLLLREDDHSKSLLSLLSGSES